jgi:hypothetical protein
MANTGEHQLHDLNLNGASGGFAGPPLRDPPPPRVSRERFQTKLFARSDIG